MVIAAQKARNFKDAYKQCSLTGVPISLEDPFPLGTAQTLSAEADVELRQSGNTVQATVALAISPSDDDLVTALFPVRNPAVIQPSATDE